MVNIVIILIVLNEHRWTKQPEKKEKWIQKWATER